MKTGLPHAAGTPEKMMLGGREYTISPLEVSDFAEMEKWVQDAPLRRLRAQLNGNDDIVTGDVRDKLVYEAVKEGSRLGLASEEGQAMIQTLEGAQLLLWLSLRKAHADIAQKDVLGLIGFSNFKEVADAIDRVSGMSELQQGE